MPSRGFVADPAFIEFDAGRGVIRIPPVSVCHQVSTMGHFLSPTILWYHSHSGFLMVSPTEPKSFNDDHWLRLHNYYLLSQVP